MAFFHRKADLMQAVAKMNPNHGPDGLFASGSGSGSASSRNASAMASVPEKMANTHRDAAGKPGANTRAHEDAGDAHAGAAALYRASAREFDSGNQSTARNLFSLAEQQGTGAYGLSAHTGRNVGKE